MGKWGMHSGVMADEKHDGVNEKILGSSVDPLYLLLDIGMLGIYIIQWG